MAIKAFGAVGRCDLRRLASGRGAGKNSSHKGHLMEQGRSQLFTRRMVILKQVQRIGLLFQCHLCLSREYSLVALDRDDVARRGFGTPKQFSHLRQLAR